MIIKNTFYFAVSSDNFIRITHDDMISPYELYHYNKTKKKNSYKTTTFHPSGFQHSSTHLILFFLLSTIPCYCQFYIIFEDIFIRKTYIRAYTSSHIVEFSSV